MKNRTAYFFEGTFRGSTLFSQVGTENKVPKHLQALEVEAWSFIFLFRYSSKLLRLMRKIRFSIHFSGIIN